MTREKYLINVNLGIQTRKISKELKETMLSLFVDNELEIGGFLGAKEGEIVSYFLDEKGMKRQRSYGPTIYELNKVIRSWEKEGVSFVGFFHSHGNGFGKLSTSDKTFFRDFLNQNQGLPYLICPIIYEPHEGEKDIAWFHISRSNIEQFEIEEY